MTSSRFEKVATRSEIQPGRSIVRVLNDHEIAIFRVGEEFFAVSNICPHQHSPVLFEGILEGRTVTCPLHGWSFDLATGTLTGGGGGIATYTLRIEGEDILVEYPSRPPGASWFNFDDNGSAA